mgnify:CR=1 FL=1
MGYTIKFILLLGLLLAGEAIWAQSEAIRLSKARERAGASRTHSLLHHNDDFFYVLRTDARFTYAEFETYDSSLNFLRASDIAPKHERKYSGALNVVGNIYLLSLQYKHDAEKDIYEGVRFVAYPVDTTTMQLREDSILLVEPFRMESNYYRGNFAISPDRSKILLYDYEEKGDIEELPGLTNVVTLRVFDNQLRLLWKRRVDLAPNSTAQRMVVLKKFRINNNGTVAILTDVFRADAPRTYLTKTVSVDPTLFFVGREEEEFLRYTPQLGDFFYSQSDFAFDRRGHIHWVGCYSTERYHLQGGIFYLQLNASCTRVVLKKRHAFSPELIAATLARRKPSEKRQLRDFKLASWRIHPQTNELTIALECQPPATYNFKSHQLLLLRLDTLGDMRWATPLQKWGDVGESYATFLSHYLCVQGDYAYVMYNDGIYENNRAFVARFDSSGNMQRRMLFRYDEQQDLLCPRLSYPVGEQIFICLQTRFFKQHRFGLLDLRTLFKQ